MRVLLADDSPEVRSALRLLLRQLPGYELVGEAEDGAALLSACEALRPDVVLLDWELPGAQVFAENAPLRFGSVSTVKVLAPDAHVIALSVLPQASAEALGAGADAFVCKSDPPRRLIDVLDALGASSRDERRRMRDERREARRERGGR